MALITIELPNESFDVEIEGDQPNEAEQAAIESLIKQKTVEADTSSTEETVEEAPKFDEALAYAMDYDEMLFDDGWYRATA